MSDLVKITGIFVASFGFSFMIAPRVYTGCLSYWKGARKLKIASILKIVIGVIFLLSARYCKSEWVIYVLGGFAVMAGSVNILFGTKWLDDILSWLIDSPQVFKRFLGAAYFVFGVLIVMAV